MNYVWKKYLAMKTLNLPTPVSESFTRKVFSNEAGVVIFIKK